MITALVLPKLDGVELAIAAADGLSQTYVQTKKSIRTMMSGARKAQQNYDPKITTTISGRGWMLPGWEGIDLSSSLTLSCAEAKTIADASNVITIPSARRSDVALRAFAYIDGVWQPATFGTAGDIITVTLAAGATQYMVGFYPEFGAFIEIDQNGRQGWSLTAEEV